tara:strand:- start:755 stop:1048 length:294 start_codon:yes stop_codon:yes gene_type:complete
MTTNIFPVPLLFTALFLTMFLYTELLLKVIVNLTLQALLVVSLIAHVAITTAALPVLVCFMVIAFEAMMTALLLAVIVRFFKLKGTISVKFLNTIKN